MENENDFRSMEAKFVGRNFKQPINGGTVEISQNENGEYSLGFIPSEAEEVTLFGNQQFAFIENMCVGELKELGKAIGLLIDRVVQAAEEDTENSISNG